MQLSVGSPLSASSWSLDKWPRTKSDGNISLHPYMGVEILTGFLSARVTTEVLQRDKKRFHWEAKKMFPGMSQIWDELEARRYRTHNVLIHS